MTTEELLKPRYKVIAEFPKCRYTTGELLPSDSNWNFEVFPEHYFDESYLKKYPHLFKKLEWWEHREEKDMPEYVSTISKSDFYKVYDNEDIINVTRAGYGIIVNHLGEHSTIYYGNFLPATESDYTTFIKNSKQ